LRQLINAANALVFGINTDGNMSKYDNKIAKITSFSKEILDKSLVSTFVVRKFY